MRTFSNFLSRFFLIFFASSAAEVEAARRSQAEHWEKAKKHGDTAKQVSSEESTRRMEQVEGTKATSYTSSTKETSTATGTKTGTTTRTTEGGTAGEVPSALSDIVQPAGQGTGGSGGRASETGATDLSKTVPSRPRETKAGGVSLPVEESEEQYRRAEEAKQRSSVKE